MPFSTIYNQGGNRKHNHRSSNIVWDIWYLLSSRVI